MKRFSVIFVVLALCLCMCACGGPTHVDDCLFETVASYNDCVIYRNVKTDVLYVYMNSALSILFNADGTPMVWEGH